MPLLLILSVFMLLLYKDSTQLNVYQYKGASYCFCFFAAQKWENVPSGRHAPGVWACASWLLRPQRVAYECL